MSARHRAHFMRGLLSGLESMRILHLIDSGGVYGAERILLYLAREQKRLGHEPCIASIARPQTLATPLEQAARSWGLEVLPIRIPRAPTPAALRYLVRRVRSYAAHVLHSHGYKTNVLLGPLPRRWRGPMVATLHGWTNSRAFTPLWFYERLDGWSLRSIDAVAVVTRHMLELPPVRRLSRDRVTVVENGIPPLSERLADMAAAGIVAVPAPLLEFMKEAPTYVAIGRLSPEKGFELLVEAFAAANARNGNRHRLLIVGEGPQRPELERRIGELGLRQSIRLTGFMEGADRLLEHAAGFVMSSYTEGMPLVLLEALQWRVPILATSVGAIPDILRAHARGTVVPARDEGAFGDALAVLMVSQSAGAVTCSAIGAETPSTYQMAEKYSRVYQRIV